MGKKPRQRRKQKTFIPTVLEPLAEDKQVNVLGYDAGAAVAATLDDGGDCDDDDDDGDSAATSVSMYRGDSACSSEASSTAVAVEEAGEGIASGGGEPRERRHFKPPPPPPRQPRDTTPICSEKPRLRPPATPRLDGNIGWFFANWGQVPPSGPKRDRIDTVLKKNPATVIGLCECDAITDAYLRLPTICGKKKDDADADPQLRVDTTDSEEERFNQRDQHCYFTLRGQEEVSILLGVRAGLGNGLKMLFWERRDEGTYKRDSGGRGIAYSRCLIAEVTLDLSAGALGTSHVIMVNHIHNEVANKGPNSEKQKEHLLWLAGNIKKYNVQVIMGDYNMVLFHAISVFRSCGIVVNVGAWYPWKSTTGQPMSDSCGIFFVNLPGEFRLHNGLSCLHSMDHTGLFYKDRPAVAGRVKGQTYDRAVNNAGPGKPLEAYVPKGTSEVNWLNKIKPFLMPCEASAALVGRYGHVKQRGLNSFCRNDVQTDFLRVKEKRLHPKHWLVKGAPVGGSHFPLCVFTFYPGRRKNKAVNERRDRRYYRQLEKSKEACRSCGAQGPLSDHEATETVSRRNGGAQGQLGGGYGQADRSGWWTSSWVSNDGATGWHCWWTGEDASSGATYASSSTWQDRPYE